MAVLPAACKTGKSDGSKSLPEPQPTSSVICRRQKNLYQGSAADGPGAKHGSAHNQNGNLYAHG